MAGDTIDAIVVALRPSEAGLLLVSLAGVCGDHKSDPALEADLGALGRRISEACRARWDGAVLSKACRDALERLERSQPI